MTHRFTSSYLRRTLLTSAVVCIVAAPQVKAQQQRTFVSGEIILYCQPNTPRPRVDELAKKINAEVTPLLLADCYKLVLPVSQTLDNDTLAGVSVLKMEADVRNVKANPFYSKDQTKTEPNDPRYKSGEQYSLQLGNLPLAWTLQKGSAVVNVAVIDSGFQPTHEDMQGQYAAGSYDIADNDADITAGAPDAETNHGTFVAGVIAAKTNNNIGIAAVCWENIKVVALKIQKNGNANLDGAAIINAYAYLLTNKDKYNVRVVNMSYGSQGGNPGDTTDPEYVGLKALADIGIILVATAGNSYPASSSVHLPGGYPFVVSVGAVGRSGKRAYYSQIDKVDIAAPGGDQTGGDAEGILGLSATGYVFEQGTSFAAPFVAGVLGLIMSVPGVTPSQAVQVMKDTANRANVAGKLPDPTYGYGLVDAYQALLKVSTTVVISSPVGLDKNGNNTDVSGTAAPIETLRPHIRFTTSNIQATNVTVTVTIDGSAITQDSSRVQAGRKPGAYAGQFIYDLELLLTPDQINKPILVTISGQPNDMMRPAVTDTRQITVRPKILRGVTLQSKTGTSNIAFISIPYYEDASIAPRGTFREYFELLGQDVTLYRWATASGGYSTSLPNSNGIPTIDPRAKFKADGIITATTGVGTDTSEDVISDARPLGLAYFANLPNAKEVITYGKESKLPVRIPLHEGWNMIGDPFPYPVSFNALTIETGTENISIGQASDRGILLPFIYRYVNGDYDFASLPGGLLQPWEGHWFFVRPQPGSVNSNAVATLVVPPTQGGSASRQVQTTVVKPVSGAGAWAIKLEARTKDLHDSNNIIGVTSGSNSVKASSRAPKPPKPAPYVSIGMVGLDEQGTQYSQVLQSTGGTKTWDVVVNSDQTDADVSVTWPAIQPLPKTYRLTMTDKATGQTVDMRQNASYTFNTGRNAATRNFVITATPASANTRVTFSNIYVNPGGGRGQDVFEIGYTVSQEVKVEVSILTLSGRAVANIGGTRAASTGDNRVVWNGKDAGGKPVSAGTYALQFRAVTSDGSVTRETRPFVVTR